MVHDRFSKNYSALRAFARDAPAEPGVYLWRDDEKRIIYVGKARNLHNRLGSYFSGQKDVKTAALISHSKSIETIIVSNEYEALLLENNFIKQHNPKYNINLKDGKTYPVVRISAGAFPRVFRTRHIVEDGSIYFGPFPNVQVLDRTLTLIEKLFPLRKCRTLKKREKPCLYYHLKRCLAPCNGKVEEEVYKNQVERVRKLLVGETSALIADFTVQMHKASAAMKFEEAAGFRNAIQAIESLSENNSVVDMEPSTGPGGVVTSVSENRDYISWAAEGIFTTFSVLSIRGGRMTGQELFSSRSVAEENESLESFIVAYYTSDRPPPPRIYLMSANSKDKPQSAQSFTAENTKTPEKLRNYSHTPCFPSLPALNQFFLEQFAFSPELVSPAADEKRHTAALAMALQNAQEELRKRLRERGVGPALDELTRVLGLKTRPERIEGFDIAQLEGRHPVASLISFKNGLPDRKNYRHFKLKTVVGIVDDFASMREAVQRRYSRLVREPSTSPKGEVSRADQELPDLVLIDGGIGQVNAAKGVMDELGINCCVAGLAKQNEEIWLPHATEPIVLSRRSEALKVLQFVRDETHRFATGLNQRLRSKDLNFPVLESINGIGPKRAAAIMKCYENLEKIAAAEPEEMAEKCKITTGAAKAVRAAARLTLEDSTQRKKLFATKAAQAAGSPAALAALAAEAAEDTPKYARR